MRFQLSLLTSIIVLLQCQGQVQQVDWECTSRDNAHYCIYTNSLCIDMRGSLFLLTNNESMSGTWEGFSDANHLHDSPFHFPDLLGSGNVKEVTSMVAPYRSHLNGVTHIHRNDLPRDFDFEYFDGDNLLVAFEPNPNSNFYHFVNKLSVAFLVRFYEMLGFGRSSSSSNPSWNIAKEMLDSLLLRNDVRPYKRALLLRSEVSSWQKGYADIAVGKNARFLFSSEIDMLLKVRPICFERVVVPGAALYLGDSLLTNMVFREMAAAYKGIRVHRDQRNVITFLDQSHVQRRRILNLKELVRIATEEEASSRAGKPDAVPFIVMVASFTEHDSFETQAKHMARTRVLISTHGNVLCHSLMMEPGGVVYELNGYQFNYPLDQQIVGSRGHYYMRDEVPLENTKAQGYGLGVDPFPNNSFDDCARDLYRCYPVRRDADIICDVTSFRKTMKQIMSIFRSGQSAGEVREKTKDDVSAPTPMPSATPSPSSSLPPQPPLKIKEDLSCELVIVLTVWKRSEMLEKQLRVLKDQSVLRRFDSCVIIYQNGKHVDIASVVDKWKEPVSWESPVTVSFIHSVLETGYFGRFLAPLAAEVTRNAYFIVFDDDVLFADMYLENMLRLVDEGFLATRVGRFIINKQEVSLHVNATAIVTSEVDLGPFDFGGQIWAGKLKWLRLAWNHPPPTIVTHEDFWLSAVLKMHQGILTKCPKCPIANWRMCACSHLSALKHESAIINNVEIDSAGGSGKIGFWNVRSEARGVIEAWSRFRPLEVDDPGCLQKYFDALTVETAQNLNWAIEGVFKDCHTWSV